MDQIKRLMSASNDPALVRWIPRLLLAADALLCALIIWKVPYTEIDWDTYMQQIGLYVKGERDYAAITGDTGPLVYPGLHVYIYRLLYAVTDQGTSIFTGQVIFAGLYISTLWIVMECYKTAKVPLYIFPLLILSKRLHSIFMLRMFNDCFTVLFLFSAIYFYQKRYWNIGTSFFTCALGVKMNALLIAPGVAFILLQALGIDRSVTQAMIVAQSQGLFAYEFVRVDWRSYVSSAFQLNRQFLYKWTVNWRFVPEDIFLSSTFSSSLLAVHGLLLLLFCTTRWTKPARRSLIETIRLYFSEPDEDAADQVSDRVTPEFVMTTILSANAIGMLCARSLHYQFYSWTAWATPYLLWRAGFHPVLVYGIWAAQEYAWNVYPSTDLSSAVAVCCLAVTVLGVWWGTRNSVEGPVVESGKKNE